MALLNGVNPCRFDGVAGRSYALTCEEMCEEAAGHSNGVGWPAMVSGKGPEGGVRELLAGPEGACAMGEIFTCHNLRVPWSHGG